MSFQEKSITASLVITLVIWGNYFFRMYEYTERGTATLPVLGSLLISAVILTVIIEIVAQALIAGYASRKDREPDKTDERDRAIVHRATYYASYILVAGVVVTVLVALATESLVSALNILILHFIAAEVWRYATQLYFYRRGF